MHIFCHILATSFSYSMEVLASDPPVLFELIEIYIVGYSIVY